MKIRHSLKPVKPVAKPTASGSSAWTDNTHRPGYELPLNHFTAEAIEARVRAAMLKTSKQSYENP